MKCVICEIAAKTRKATIVLENNEFIAFESDKPKGPKHLVIAPREHFPTLVELGAHRHTLEPMLAFCLAVAAEQKLSSFRVVLNVGRRAGQRVMHVNAHVVEPRE